MAVLTCTYDLCFEQKYEDSQNISNENCHFYSHEKSLYVAWACFRNGLEQCNNVTLPLILYKSRVQ